MSDELFEATLSDWARRTEALGPRAGFQMRVMAAVAARAAAALRNEVVRSARLLVPAAFLLAAISVGWASKTDTVSSAAVAAVEQRWEYDF
jgi:hypothetical protein